MTKKQRNIIERIKYFIPDNISISPVTDAERSYYKLIGIQEGVEGVDSEAAFLDYTNRGVRPEIVKDLRYFANLLVGLQRMTLQMEMWTEDFVAGLLFLSDFDDEPESVRSLALKAYENGKRNFSRYSTRERYFPNEYTRELLNLNYFKK